MSQKIITIIDFFRYKLFAGDSIFSKQGTKSYPKLGILSRFTRFPRKKIPLGQRKNGQTLNHVRKLLMSGDITGD